MVRGNHNTPTMWLTVSALALSVAMFGCSDEAPETQSKQEPASLQPTDSTPLTNKPVDHSDIKLEEPIEADQPDPSSDEFGGPEDPVYQIQTSADPKIYSTIIGRRPNLNLEFVNQDGKPVNLERSYAGKTLVISTIFTTCPMPDMCARITADFGWLADELPDDLRDDVQLILISFDPQRDTPAVLKAFGAQNGIDFEITDLLRGEIEATRAIMEDELEIPLEINPTTNLIVTHAMMLHVINPDGFIVVERTVNTSEPMEIILKEIERAVNLPFDPTLIESVETEDG